MNKKDFATIIAEKMGIKTKPVVEIMDCIFDTIKEMGQESVDSGEPLDLNFMGTFKVTVDHKDARERYNPVEGKKTMVAETDRLKIRLSPSYRNLVSASGAKKVTKKVAKTPKVEAPAVKKKVVKKTKKK